jgi:mannose-1-phosphate guanylyltransferase
VSVWNPAIFQRMPEAKKISFIPILVEWIREGGRIGGVVAGDGKWFNIGSRTDYLQVHRTIGEARWKPTYVTNSDWPLHVAKTATVDPSATIRGCSVVGEDCRVGAGAILDDTVVWPASQIASRSDLLGCIVRSRKKVEGIHRNADI